MDVSALAATVLGKQEPPNIATAVPESKPYQPFGACMELFYAKDDEVIIDGPAGTGKSRAALEKIHLLLCKYPGARGLLVRKTRESLTQSAMVTYDQWVVPQNGRVRWRTTEQEYRYWNGSKFIIGGMDKSSRIMSTEYDTIFIQEGIELTEAEFEALTTRARNAVVPYNQVILDCNPSFSRHWVKRRWEEGKARRLKSTHQNNPTLWDHQKNDWTPRGKAYARRLQKLTGTRYKRLWLGEWVSAEGLVYPEFMPDIHVIPNFTIPEDWRRICAIDFGYTNPFVCQWWALDHDDNAFLYREIYMTRRTVRAHAEAINELSKDEAIEVFVCDHDAEDRATLEEHGIYTIPAIKAISTGIESVKERLIVDEGTGLPRFFIFEDTLVELDQGLRENYKPTKTREEFEDYIWANHATKEIPVQKDNHGIDSARYLVQYLESASMTGGIYV